MRQALLVVAREVLAEDAEEQRHRVSKVPNFLLIPLIRYLIYYTTAARVATRLPRHDESDYARQKDDNNNGIDNGEPVDLVVSHLPRSSSCVSGCTFELVTQVNCVVK